MEDGIELRILLCVDLVEPLGDIARTMRVDEFGDRGCVQLAAGYAQAFSKLFRLGEERVWDRDCSLHRI